MSTFLGAFPILPGKADDAKKFAAEVAGPRLGEFEILQHDTGTTREVWSVAAGPGGDAMLVYFEAEDIEAVFAQVAAGDSGFLQWFRQSVEDVTGIDLTAPGDGSMPEVVLDWQG